MPARASLISVIPSKAAVAANRDARETVPRALIISLALFAALLLAVGLTSSWCFKKVDSGYSSLVVRTAADLNRVHDIAFHSGLSYATIVELAITPDQQRRAELIRLVTAERAANDKVFQELVGATTDPGIRSCLDEVIAKRRIFREESDTLISSTPSPLIPRTSRQLFPAFVAYQNACDKLGDLIQAKSLRWSEQLTKEVGRLRALFSGLGVVPIAAALGLLVIIVYLVRTTPTEIDLS